MRRRHFLGVLSGATVELSLSGRAQSKAVPVIGFLSSRSSKESSSASEAFLDALREAGYIEGQNVAIEYRWAEGQPDRLRTLAVDLAERGVTVIFAAGGTEPASCSCGGAQNSYCVHKRCRSCQGWACFEP